MSSTKHEAVGTMRAVDLYATPSKAKSCYGESNSKPIFGKSFSQISWTRLQN